MSDDRDSQPGQSARLLRALIWVGVGLAPVAAVVAMLGGSANSVRFAVVLVAVCVVLIGSSILIRSDPVLLGIDAEDRVGQETDALRTELRAEFAAAARATHHRVQSLQEEVGRLRGAPAPARPEPGLSTGARAAAAAVVPTPGRATGDRSASAPGRATGDRPASTPGRVTGDRSVSAPGRATGGRPVGVGHSVAGVPAPADRPIGGRATVTPSAPGWPDTEQAPHRARPGQVAGARAAVAVGVVVPPAPRPVGPIPGQRAAAGVAQPAMAPVFRPPMPSEPHSAEYASSAGEYAGPGQTYGSAAQPGRYGSPRPVDQDPSYGGRPGRPDDPPPGWADQVGQDGWTDQSGRSDQAGEGGWTDQDGRGGWTDQDGRGGWTDQDGRGGWTDQDARGGWADQAGQGFWADDDGDPGRGQGREPHRSGHPGWPDEEPSYGGQPSPRRADGPIYGRPETHWADDDPSYGGQPGWAAQDQPGWTGEDPGYGGRTGWAGEEPSYGGQPGRTGDELGAAEPGWIEEPDRPHKRRADVTAIDLGYTGRRSRPGHARTEGRPDPDDAGAEQYWRQPADHDRW
jgi:hypothetical protein